MKIKRINDRLQIFDDNNTLRLEVSYQASEYGYVKLHSELSDPLPTVVRYNSKGKKVKENFYFDGRKLTQEQIIKRELNKWVNDETSK